MKKISLLIIILIATKSYSQNIFIPYKSGNKFGLCDETGKVVLTPKYDNVEFLEKDFFRYENYKIEYDTAKSLWGDIKVYEKKQVTSGLIYKTTPVINNQNFISYTIEKPFIIATGAYNSGKPNMGLYTLEGKKLLPQLASNIHKTSKYELGKLPSETQQEVLISTGSSYSSGGMSIGVYNKAKKVITHWLIRNVKSYDLDDRRSTNTATYFTYKDSAYNYHNKKITIVKEKYVITTSEAEPEKNADLSKYEESKYYDDYSIGTINQEGYKDDYLVEAPRVVESDGYNSGYKSYSSGTTYYFRNDSLYFAENYGTKKEINLPKNIKLIFNNSYEIGTNKYYNNNYNYFTYTQYTSVIYKLNDKFGLIVKEAVKEAVYDSLVYLTNSNNYMAGKKINGVMQYGIINNQEKEIVQIRYDSLKTNFTRYEFNYDKNNSSKKELKIVNEPIRTYYAGQFVNNYTQYSSSYIQAYKYGKTGFIDFEDFMIVPVEYDAITRSISEYSKGLTSYYFILKKDNKYGLATVTTENGRYIMNKKLAPVFRYIPLTYFEDYYGKQGFNLYKLYKENGEFAGYADKSGREFFKN